MTAGPVLDCWQYHIRVGRDVVIVTYGCDVASTAPPQVSSEHKGAGLFTLAEVPGLAMPARVQALDRRLVRSPRRRYRYRGAAPRPESLMPGSDIPAGRAADIARGSPAASPRVRITEAR